MIKEPIAVFPGPLAEQSCTPHRSLFLTLRVAVFTLVLAAAGLLLPAAQSLAQESALSVEASSVNINIADAPELARRLNGIGASRAEAIVRYREAYGPFETVDELAQVAGVGIATVERNRKLITLE